MVSCLSAVVIVNVKQKKQKKAHLCQVIVHVGSMERNSVWAVGVARRSWGSTFLPFLSVDDLTIAI